MNYKVLAISAFVGVSLIAAVVMEAQKPAEVMHATERLTTVDAEEPQTRFGFNEALEERAPTPAAIVAPPPPPRVPREGEISGNDTWGGTVPSVDIPVSMPQIAYVFTFGYRVPGPRIPALQQRHADLCESKGPTVCRIISMDQSGSEGDYSSGTLQLAVASSEARSFGKQLATLAERDDGEQVSAAIAGEDLSKRIVDTEARLRARTVLRDRLMEVLATRRGTVTELVEAERGVAQVNEEIDQARSWLSEMRNRVAFSRLDITYESGAPATGGFMEPVRAAIGSLGPIFGNLLGVLILLGSLALPVLLVWWGVRALRRRGVWPAPATPQAAAA
jgi:hypothetical protein